eukprot:TRINITY_DN6082_c0_g2_i1.p1 TRINITY_DN6082_c0_g2~~TRINITY_DN6082_c0_g2_i1.p1  ORF type:complete len:1067 (+),score=291.99 TRINITY_DN6082_c0_g2_i1:60-3260(+)
MSAKAITEADGKRLLTQHMRTGTVVPSRSVSVLLSDHVDYTTVGVESDQWVRHVKLVAKPDQLIKRRGKLGLIKINVDFDDAVEWIESYRDNTINIEKATGVLDNFIMEPFLPHEQTDEYYIALYSTPDGDDLMFYHEGGVDIGDVDSKAVKVSVPTDIDLTSEQVDQLISEVPEERKEVIQNFVQELFRVYRKLQFTYLEINPLVVVNNEVHILDLAAKLDQTAEFEMGGLWGEINYPAPFGRGLLPEEKHIAELDSKTGASLKLTIMNPEGRVWTMVAGGGASVVYTDTICHLGFADELANYGEYSGAPSVTMTYEYAKTILQLMTKTAHPDGKVLIIGGSIANFTNVASTFKGIIKALREFQVEIREHDIKIFVRRGGPNYQEGLKHMKETAVECDIPIHVYGPDVHITSVIPMALGLQPIKENGGEISLNASAQISKIYDQSDKPQGAAKIIENENSLFTPKTRSFVFGMQTRAVQSMLDFDHISGRSQPSVAAMIYPFSSDHKIKVYWGQQEILMPVYQKLSTAFERHPEVDVLVNFASLRSAYSSTMEALEFDRLRVIAIIAEGIPEQKTKSLNKKAAEKGVVIIGPATVGAIKPGCFKIGNTGGSLDNIISSKLYRPGNCAYVSKSGGMSNELNNILSRTTNGVYEGVAIGGDRYPGSSFIDHIIRYQNDENVKLIVLLGELGGLEEYKLCDALKSGQVTKPVVAWCMGTCADYLTTEVQFGHAGALANSGIETSAAKNKAMREAGCHVPECFDDFGTLIAEVWDQILADGLELIPEPEPPQMPIDYNWAVELGLIRKPTSFVSSISDERGEELSYGGIPISEILELDLGIGGVIGLLWFKKNLPEYARKFFELCLVITADHGPAVSGAHNTIVAARAGKDVISSLVSGLLTIGDRFGGALDGAARQFSAAFDQGLSPAEFVIQTRRNQELIMGIGHKVKSINNPDKRVELIKQYVFEHFPKTDILEYALKVERITTSKKANLILNVDGIIAVSFVDLLRNSGIFTPEEADEYISIGVLNALFVVGRSIGFVGHYLDQKRLKQGLYRHPWDDISYIQDE